MKILREATFALLTGLLGAIAFVLVLLYLRDKFVDQKVNILSDTAFREMVVDELDTQKWLHPLSPSERGYK